MVRSELSKKNKYWIEKHRFLELRHFCRQYNHWKAIVRIIDGYSTSPEYAQIRSKIHGDPTAKAAVLRAKYSDRMTLLEDVAKKTDPVIGNYILEAVSEGISYDHLNARKQIPCGKDVYYDLYRKFFYLLDNARN